MSTSVVRGGNCTETLLSSSIPLIKYTLLDIDTTYKPIPLTICNLTVFPSSSMVLIFYHEISQDENTHYTMFRRIKPYKINTNSRDVTFGISIICETQQETRLSYTRVTNKQKLEQIVTIHYQMREYSCVSFIIKAFMKAN